jgi:hypothetical protein
MELYFALMLIVLVGLILFVIARRPLAARPRQVRPHPSYDPFSAERIDQAFIALRTTLNQQPAPITVLPHSGYPDAIQWLRILQQAPDDAADLQRAIRKQVSMRGPLAEVISIDSLIAREAAQRYLRTVGAFATLQAHAPASRALGNPMYLTEQEWQQRLVQFQASFSGLNDVPIALICV